MKLLLTFILSMCCTVGIAQKVSRSPLAKLDWLVGNWSLANPKQGTTGGETWKKGIAGEMIGLGFDLKETDTVFMEKMKLVEKGGKLFFTADVKENKEITWFELTALGPSGFTAENPEHDFPTKIVYRSDAKDHLSVIVSGGNKSQEYIFKRL